MENKSITWKGLGFYNTTEICNITFGDTIEINSIITGQAEDIPFSAQYFIQTDTNWKTQRFEVRSIISEKKQEEVILSRDQDDNWILKGQRLDMLKSCAEIDISVTPFTNTLAIHHLKLEPGEEKKIEVLYVNVIDHELKRAEQIYTRISPFEYRFATIEKDFTAVIAVDNLGLVVNYPELFTRM